MAKAPQRARKGISDLVNELVKPVLAPFRPQHHVEASVDNSVSDSPTVSLTFYWKLADLGFDPLNMQPKTSGIVCSSFSNKPMDEQVQEHNEGRLEETKIFRSTALGLFKRLQSYLEQAGLENVSLTEFNPTLDFDLAIDHDTSRYEGLRVVISGNISRTKLGLRSAEDEIQERLEDTRKRWESFLRRKNGNS